MKRKEIDWSLYDKLVSDGLIQTEIAKILGFHVATLERKKKRLGYPKLKTGPKMGDRHPCWKGGRKLVGGYWYVYKPDHPYCKKDRCVLEHRIILEDQLGRYLLPGEVVHHINGDSKDNRLENLIVFRTNADHLRVELKGKVPNWTSEGWAKMKSPRKRKQTYDQQ